LSRHHLADLAAVDAGHAPEIRFGVYWDRENALDGLGLSPKPE
jgi:hypothetical protein